MIFWWWTPSSTQLSNLKSAIWSDFRVVNPQNWPYGNRPNFWSLWSNHGKFKPVQQLFEKSQPKKKIAQLLSNGKKTCVYPFTSPRCRQNDCCTAAFHVESSGSSALENSNMCSIYIHINLIHRSTYIPDKQPALVSGWFSELPRLVGYVIVSWRVHLWESAQVQRVSPIAPATNSSFTARLSKVIGNTRHCPLRIGSSYGASRKISIYHFFTLGTDWCGSYK